MPAFCNKDYVDTMSVLIANVTLCTPCGLTMFAYIAEGNWGVSLPNWPSQLRATEQFDTPQVEHSTLPVGKSQFPPTSLAPSLTRDLPSGVTSLVPPSHLLLFLSLSIYSHADSKPTSHIFYKYVDWTLVVFGVVFRLSVALRYDVV